MVTTRIRELMKNEEFAVFNLEIGNQKLDIFLKNQEMKKSGSNRNDGLGFFSEEC